MSHRFETPGSHQPRLAQVSKAPMGGVLVIATTMLPTPISLADVRLAAMAEGGPLSLVAGVVIVDVWVIPAASRTEIKGIHDDALRVRVAAPPAGGAANKALLGILADRIGKPVAIVNGAASRRKQIRVETDDVASVAAALGLGQP